MALNEPRCYLCGTPDRKQPVFEATAEEVAVKKVPVGVGLCGDCAFMSEEELADAAQVTAADRMEVAARRSVIAEELEADLEEDRKEWARWTNTFGGW